MLEKLKEKCKAISRNRAVVVTLVCVVLVITLIASISIATNRAKKKEAGETNTQQGTESEEATEEKLEDGTLKAPVHNATESMPVSGEIEEFLLDAPVQGSISKGHDASIQVWSETMGDYRVHLGIDIAADDGAPVKAAADGVVSKIWDDALMGRCVAISHDGDIYTFYKNLDPVLADGIEEGSNVKRGQSIGCVGDSAIAELADEPHLHIEMTVKGLAVDPRDYFNADAQSSLMQHTVENFGK